MKMVADHIMIDPQVEIIEIIHAIGVKNMIDHSHQISQIDLIVQTGKIEIANTVNMTIIIVIIIYINKITTAMVIVIAMGM